MLTELFHDHTLAFFCLSWGCLTGNIYFNLCMKRKILIPTLCCVKSYSFGEHVVSVAMYLARMGREIQEDFISHTQISFTHSLWGQHFYHHSPTSRQDFCSCVQLSLSLHIFLCKKTPVVHEWSNCVIVKVYRLKMFFVWKSPVIHEWSNCVIVRVYRLKIPCKR